MRRLCFTAGLFALLFVLAATPSYAQGILAGIKGGPNFATLSFDPEESDCCDMMTRFAIGGYVEKGLRSNFGAALEVLYNQLGAKASDGSDGEIIVDTIQIPILAKARFGSAMSKFKPFAVTGPGLGFTTAAKFKEGGQEEDLKANDEVESFLFSWIFGFGVHAGPATIEIRYDLGLSNIAKDDNDSVKSRTFSLLFGYGFGGN